MFATMHLSILVSLLTVCYGTNISSVNEEETVSTTSVHKFTSQGPSSSVKVTTTTLQSQKATHQFTTEDPTASPRTPRTEGTNLNSSFTTTFITQAPNETVSQEHTVPSTSGRSIVTESSTRNTTSPALSPKREKDDLAANLGLVAVICIFCIVLTLVLVVLTVKCVRSQRSNFERLEDVPMGKVNEESPFALYSK